jgi:DNA-binding transcriptional LysR family regulator
MNSDDISQFFYKANRQQQLRGFIYTANFGSFSKAAAYMKVGQPTVSIQVKSLEEQLGVKLFERSGPKIRLTEDGELLFSIGAPLLKQFDQIYDDFLSRKTTAQSETLKIVANHGSMQFLLPPYVGKFLKTNGSKRLELHYAKSYEALEKIRAGTAEIYIGPQNFKTPPEFIVTPLFSFKAVALVHRHHCLAKNKSVSLTTLMDHELTLLPKELSVIEGLHSILENQQGEYSSKIKFYNWEMLLEYVAQGIITTIGAEFLSKYSSKIKAVQIKEKLPRANYVVVRLKSRTVSKSAAEFIDLLSS